MASQDDSAAALPTSRPMLALAGAVESVVESAKVVPLGTVVSTSVRTAVVSVGSDWGRVTEVSSGKGSSVSWGVSWSAMALMRASKLALASHIFEAVHKISLTGHTKRRAFHVRYLLFHAVN